MGIVKPASGTITLDGRPIQRAKPHRIARLGVGYVPEDRRIFPRLTVRENLLMGRIAKKETPVSQEGWTLERIYALFPILKQRETQRGATLSGGEQQMLTIARTLMGNPELLLVDEPTEGLAPLVRKMVGEVLLDIHRNGVSILLVEQNMHVALSLAERAYVMSKGRIVFSGTSEEIREAEEVRRRYLEV
jgi:branched-chain amino acid transport system ATP-binding protein